MLADRAAVELRFAGLLVDYVLGVALVVGLEEFDKLGVHPFDRRAYRRDETGVPEGEDSVVEVAHRFSSVKPSNQGPQRRVRAFPSALVHVREEVSGSVQCFRASSSESPRLIVRGAR